VYVIKKVLRMSSLRTLTSNLGIWFPEKLKNSKLKVYFIISNRRKRNKLYKKSPANIICRALKL